MTPKRRRTGVSPLDGKRATVTVQRGGAEIIVHDVNAAQAFHVLVDMLEAFQGVEQGFPEIKPREHDHHGDYAPLYVFETEDEELKRPKPAHERPPTVAGFHAPPKA